MALIVLKGDSKNQVESWLASKTASGSRAVLLSSLPGVILCLCCLLPFLNKPFTIDDPLFLQEAQHILVSPLHPMQTRICWNKDNWCGPLSLTAPNNLLIAYIWAPLVAAGAHEWAAHLFQIFMLTAAIVATVSLAFRFGFDRFSACAAGLLLAATPPVLAMASTAMPDVLAMSLGILGIERFVAWRQEGKTAYGILSAIFLGLAMFARLHMILIWACCGVLLHEDAKVLNARSWLALKNRLWPLAAAALLFFAAVILTREPGSSGGPGSEWISWHHIFRNGQSYVLDWVLAMPLGLAWLLLRNRSLNRWALIVALAFLAPVATITALHVTRIKPAAWELLSLTLGIVVLTDLYLWAFRGSDLVRIFCAACLLVPLAALVYIHLPVKFLLPSAPATALLIVDVARPVRWRPVAIGIVLVAGIIWAVLVLRADARFAEVGRDFAMKAVKPLVARGNRVWFVSEWSLQWYALKVGAKPLWTNQIPAPGDYIVRGELEGYPETPKRIRNYARLVATYSVGGPCGRTMSFKDDAGLYSNVMGLLMWNWGGGEWNRYEVWRVTGKQSRGTL